MQPAPKDHPWRTVKNVLGGGNGMTPHYSGTTLDAQLRYASGTKDILDNFFNDKPQNPANVIIAKSASSFLCIRRKWANTNYCVQRATSQRLMVNGELVSAIYHICGPSSKGPLVQIYIFHVLLRGPCNKAIVADIRFSESSERGCENHRS